MTDPWPILRRAGLPLGAPDPSSAVPDLFELGRAVRLAIDSQPTGRMRDALSAFVLAWCRHWPRAFARSLGSDASRVQSWARSAVTDVNRYLKLARIASEHLATVL